MGNALITRRGGGGISIPSDTKLDTKLDVTFSKDYAESFSVSGTPFFVRLSTGGIYAKDGSAYDDDGDKFAVEFGSSSVAITYYEGVSFSISEVDVSIYYTP